MLRDFVRAGRALMGGSMSVVSLRQDERGFTLIEMLFVLLLFVLSLSFLPTLMSAILTGHSLKGETTQHMSVFFNHVARDIREAQAVELGIGAIFIDKGNGDRFTIERLPKTNQIRRLRNGAGHVLMLEEVSSFQCSSNNQLIDCTVKLLSGEKMRRVMPYYYVPVKWEGEEESE